ncbi:T7-like phage DNA-directed RNA polymerase [hydrothermal vent metagenome]|uniref:DNA-directed RNA polymerase n=1 Tax=hydrothermal vent metagenome TaxID=652676 RepID=A0A1W1EJA5_9ZZZZ
MKFATKKPLGDDGEKWFKVHGANIYGEDKLSFEDRVKWIDDNSSNILDIFDTPNRFENEFLKKADKPFSFLAFAYEYREFIEDRENFKSSIPIAMDGSNNGTALLRDKKGAEKVNVLPTPNQTTPNDIYKDVADKTKDIIDKDREYRVDKNRVIDREDIEKIFEYIDRDMTKKNVMTEVYGAGKDAKIGQLREYITNKLSDKLNWNDEKIKLISNYLYIQIDKAIKKELSSSNIYKKWMKKLAKEISNQNKKIKWKTPIIGLEVIQEEFQTKGYDISTKYNNKKYQIKIQIPTDKIDDKEQTKGIAPNFVHSLDATHMFLTILNSKKEGIDSFATIHDSFATHACDTQKLQESIRKSFIEMYQEDIIENLKKDIKKEYDIELKDIKYQDNNFDYQEIKKSKYIFG